MSVIRRLNALQKVYGRAHEAELAAVDVIGGQNSSMDAHNNIKWSLSDVSPTNC